MLIHACMDCDTISINRIAADDDPATVLAVFQSSLDASHQDFYNPYDIEMLDAEDIEIVYTQLYGQNTGVATA